MSAAIFGAVAGVIPAANKDLQNILKLHQDQQDGYGLLHYLATTGLPYMTQHNDGWSPEWEHGKTPVEFAITLQSYVKRERMSGRNVYSELQQSREFIH